MTRSAFQGLRTVIRFNWHLYAGALAALITTGVAAWCGPDGLRLPAACVVGAGLLAAGASLAATWLAYDRSALYRLDWLAPWVPPRGQAANVHAGFDETTALLRARFPGVAWRVFDFYDPVRHTEISIRRARRAYPPAADTVPVFTRRLPTPDGSVDFILLMLAAHEIRDARERDAFFRELHRTLAADGVVVVTEHLRDLPNIAAYNVGAWHFHRASDWLSAFGTSGFQIVARFKPAPFITTFVLKKHGSVA